MTKNMHRDFVYLLLPRADEDGLPPEQWNAANMQSGLSVGGNRAQYVRDAAYHLICGGHVLVISSDSRRDTHPAVSCLFDPLSEELYVRHYSTFKHGRLIWAVRMTHDEIKKRVRKLKGK